MIADMVVATIIFPRLSKTSLWKPVKQAGLLYACIEGKAIPLQAWSGPEGSGKLRFPDLMTMAQVGGKVVNLTHRPPFPPGNTPGTHFCTHGWLLITIALY
jgi:hypothetical protein